MNRLYPIALAALVFFSCRDKPAAAKKPSLTNDTGKKTEVRRSPAKPLSPPGEPGIEGVYKQVPVTGENDGCNIIVTIRKTGNGYRYRLQLSDTVYNGRLTLEKPKNDTITTVTFEGIIWAEYEGDVSQLSDDAERPSLKLPVGISGDLSDGSITIQNYGNAMNYYVKIEGCEKFIRLVKSK